ncbi:trypsin-like peptidase domain-containing protein [Bordetella genomosp. 13]|uniref:2-alkenal reductase n=1 Tax=Bordetella genomosp. 13 TaxID=463040 RepID=A0A1W6Z6N7_9BORD|nr:trypsin-like peptidase domain-containing protein [Bordetella genomosp. 13]ARP93053.1 2-alkenal reductase [Bordetella genomosp. 13]
MHRLWLIFAQAVTVSLAILFVVTTLRPDWLRLTSPAVAPVPPAAPPTAPQAAQPAPPPSYADAVARAVPWVVNVYTSKHVNVPLMPLPDDPVLRELFGQVPGMSRRQAASSLGSGVIVSAGGYVLTNYHVVEAADAIEVALADGRKVVAKVVGADPDTDLAVLKLAGELGNLPVAEIAATQALRVGDVVLAIGNPFGVGQTTTQGIVSALGRNGLGINIYENFIQTDAAINPGNSGGALIDARGNLVGINTAIYSETGGSLGIGFAIPIEGARRVMDEIIRTGSVKRGWLGVEPQDITPELARAFNLPRDTRGVIIAGVVRDGPAGRSGLRVGDIVRRIDGTQVTDTAAMLAMIAALPPGETSTLDVLRAGKNVAVKVKVGTRPVRPR